MSALDLILASAVMAVGSALQGAVGFGLALITVPVLLLIDPRLVPGPVMCGAFVLTLMMALRERGDVDRFGLKWSLIGRLPGTIAGALVLSSIPLAYMGPVLGALVLLAVSMSLSGLRLTPNAPTLFVAGSLSGFMGTISSIGGPPLAMVYQHTTGARLRGTLASYFVVGTVMSLVALVMVDRFGWSEFLWSLAMIPGVILGFILSGWLVPLVDRGYTRTAVLGVSAAAALMTIAREFL